VKDRSATSVKGQQKAEQCEGEYYMLGKVKKKSKDLARATRPRGALVGFERAVEEMPTWTGRRGDGGDACAEGCYCSVAPDSEREHPVKHWSGVSTIKQERWKGNGVAYAWL
jgi:hypothetical protein